MTKKKYESPKLVAVGYATTLIQGGKNGVIGDSLNPMQPATTPGYSADE